MSEHEILKELRALKHQLEKVEHIMSLVTDFTTVVQGNLDKISSDLDSIAARIKAGGGPLSAADIAALALFQANIAAVQVKADAMVTPVAPGKAPVILTQPQAQTVITGQTATFSVVASDDAPVTYQWLFNGTIAIGTNSSVLSIPAVTGVNAGLYSVVCANAHGAAVSENAQLTVQ